ncbi:MAG: hypothetical protein HJJLKODD_01632 [Phycisphaerae bacterium]|nr:hypothetical protein [Phycisphaerae bacterium]
MLEYMDRHLTDADRILVFQVGTIRVKSYLE